MSAIGYGITNLHIEEDSLEGRRVRDVIDRECVTPHEAVLRPLRESREEKSPAEELIRMFSGEGDVALMDEAMAFARSRRQHDAPRDFGL